ncbi:hypothetical protein ACI8AC_12715 [Geodermatophilus sp. SYSU D00758]
MKYFKITRTWSVKAESEEEAFKKVAADPHKYLESEAVTRTEYKRPQQGGGGWTAALATQLTGGGSNNKR